MKFIWTIILVCFTFLLVGQTIPELEQQLAEARSSKRKMALNYELGKAYMRTDAKKAIRYAKAAHERAVSASNNSMAGEASWLISRGYNRTGEKRNEETWLKSALRFAKNGDDADLILRSVDKLSRLAKEDRNYRKAYQITEEAFNYFSSKGGRSMADLNSSFEVQKTKLEKERAALERDKKQLSDEIARLSNEKSNLQEDNVLLTERQRILEKEKEEVEEEVAQKTEEIEEVSREKAKIQRKSQQQRDQITDLELTTKEQEVEIALKEAELRNTQLEQERGQYLTILLGAVTLFLVLLALTNYFRLRAKNRSNAKLAEQNKIIEEERTRSDELLLNILPAGIAQELKETGKATAQKFNEATILFSDFKNFTKISEQLSPEKLVKEIDDTFRAFDFIISQYPDLEKIKTIGDAYMVASGLVDRKTIPHNMIKAAMEMQQYLNETKQEKMKKGELYFEARIGIHTGPVVAGVVGNKKFAYDIWGDTVNIAARMEENCEVGKVNLSEVTAGLIKYKYDVKYRGKVSVKNKGMMDMYYLAN